MSIHLVTGYAGEAHITASDQGSFNIATLGAGSYVLNKGNKFDAFFVSANVLRVKDGDLILQGRHVRIKENDTVDVSISNGTNGKFRNDLVVVRYTKNESTAVESAEIRVIKGTETSGNPEDPEYISGDITEASNDITADFPLYRIKLNGISITTPEKLFSVTESIDDILGDISDINDDIEDIQEDVSDLKAKEFTLCKNQELTFTNKVCTISDTRITADSLADVYFTKESINTAEKANISVETESGACKLTADRTPDGSMTATIMIKVV